MFFLYILRLGLGQVQGGDIIATRDCVKCCSGGSNEPLDLKIKILYIKKKLLAYFTLKYIFEHPNLNFVHPNHR